VSAGIRKPPRKKRVGHALPLLLATSASLTACSDNRPQELTTIRDQYQSLEDCRKDWGERNACEETTNTNLNHVSDTGSSASSAAHYAGGGSSGGYHSMGYGTYYALTTHRETAKQRNEISAYKTRKVHNLITRWGEV
jgi:hypothetical protein